MHSYYLRQKNPLLCFLQIEVPHPASNTFSPFYSRVHIICSITSAIITKPILLLEQQHTCLASLCSALPLDKSLTESLSMSTVFTHIASEEVFPQIPSPLPSLSYH